MFINQGQKSGRLSKSTDEDAYNFGSMIDCCFWYFPFLSA